MTEGTDRSAERGDRLFTPLAADYAAARPSYPAEVFERLGASIGEATVGTGREPPLIVDIAAGTGMATRGLLDQGLRVAAVEPAAGMLLEAVKAADGRPGWVGALAARAEALPLGGSSVAGAVVAQAFHWLDPGPALDELARVIAPRGILLLLWNVSRPNDWTREVRRLVRRHNAGRKRPVSRRMMETPRPLRSHPAFDVRPVVEVRHERSMAIDDYVRYARSWSYVGGALGPTALEAFEKELRAILERYARDGSVRERFVAAAHFARRL